MLSDNEKQIIINQDTKTAEKRYTFTENSDWFLNSKTRCRKSPAYAFSGRV